MSPKGGKREGAGRPRKPANKLRRNIVIAEWVDRIVREIGNGNRSRGIELLAMFWKKHK